MTSQPRLIGGRGWHGWDCTCGRAVMYAHATIAAAARAAADHERRAS